MFSLFRFRHMFVSAGARVVVVLVVVVVGVIPETSRTAGTRRSNSSLELLHLPRTLLPRPSTTPFYHDRNPKLVTAPDTAFCSRTQLS